MESPSPKCGSSEIILKAYVEDGERCPVPVSIVEPEPPKRPFVWNPKNEQSHFRADICGGCGYTEFYAENYKALNDDYKQGDRSK
jgi:predicted nucleic-acid-binding Zn-ribbon protein